MIEKILMWFVMDGAGAALQRSTAAFAATEALHIIALCVVGGTILAANLAVLGVVLKTIEPKSVFRQLQPLYLGALMLVIMSGALLVAAGPYKYYTNPLFPVKLALLFVAAGLHGILGHRLKVLGSAGRAERGLAAASLIFWTSVAISGRWLGLI
jgi:hypothetical protein